MIARPVGCAQFVGRREEFAALERARRGLGQSQGAVVLVAGEAGIGKSRLLAQFLRSANDKRARSIAATECLDHARQPLGPLRELVTTLAPLLREAAPAPAIARGLAQLAPDVFAPAAGNGGAEELSQAELFAAIATFFKLLAADRATILAIEDIHWADASTLEFLTYLAPRIAGTRLLVVATYRCEDVDTNAALLAGIARLIREPAVTRIELRAFSPVDLRTLVACTLDGHETLPGEMVRAVERRSEGNPFFAEELIKSELERSGRRADRGLPLSIRATIVERLARLAAADRPVLARAALLGYRFDPHVLALTLGCEVDAVLPALRHARDLSIIADDDGDHGRMRFRHALTREAVVDDLLRFDARRAHAQILAVLERLDDPQRHAEALAHHAWESKDTRKILTYNEQAALAALELHALDDADRCFSRALSVATEPGDRARLLERSAEVWRMRGDTAAAAEACQAALALHLDRGDYDAAADLARAVCMDRNNLGQVDAVAHGLAFLDEYGSRAGAAARDALLALLARIACVAYDFEQARKLLARIESLATLAPRAQQNALIARMELHWYDGDLAAWTSCALRLEALLPRLSAFNALIAAYAIARAAGLAGENVLAERALAHAELLESRRDYGALQSYGACIRATYCFLRGRFAAARGAIERAQAGAEVAVAQTALAGIAPLVAVAFDDASLLPPGHDARVQTYLESSDVSADDAIMLAAAAAWSFSRGDTARAGDYLKAAIDRCPPAIPSAGMVVILAAEQCRTRERAAVERLIASFDVLPHNVPARAHGALARAWLARRAGDAIGARGFAGTAIADYRRLNWPYYEALALEAAERFDEAIAVYDRCGVTAPQRRLRAHHPVLAVAPAARHPLSERERAVAELVAQGLTNVAIGDRLGVSVKTVEKHVGSIFVKLDLHSRTQIAAAFGSAATLRLQKSS